jgi:hypothetical protein
MAEGVDTSFDMYVSTALTTSMADKNHVLPPYLRLSTGLGPRCEVVDVHTATTTFIRTTRSAYGPLLTELFTFPFRCDSLVFAPTSYIPHEIPPRGLPLSATILLEGVTTRQ